MQAKVTDARDTVRLGPGGTLIGFTRYEYTLDDLGPFVYEVKSAEDTPEAFLKEVERRKGILKSIQGS